MATEKVVTKVKYRLKNGTSTTLPLGTTSDYIQMDDGDQENLTQRLETLEKKMDTSIRPKKLNILEVQSHLDAGTIEQYCRIGDYVELNLNGAGTTKFYVIGINGHNGQLGDHIYKDHIDFYGGAITKFSNTLPSENYTTGEETQKAAWQKTTFFENYIDGQDSAGVKNFLGLTASSYSSLNFAPKNVLYDERHTDQLVSASTALGYFGYNGNQLRYFEALAEYEPSTMGDSADIILNADTNEILLSEAFKEKINAISTDSGTALKLLRASVKLESNLKTFSADSEDALLALRQSVHLITTGQEFLRLYKLYMRIHEWVLANSIPELTSSTGINQQECYLWMLTEEEIDNNNILGTPQYTALAGYSYPFFQNKQLFRLLFPFSNSSDKVFHSITPVEGSSSKYVSWRCSSGSPGRGIYKTQGNVAQNTTIEGFGFRLESSSNKISYPSQD